MFLHHDVLFLRVAKIFQVLENRNEDHLRIDADSEDGSNAGLDQNAVEEEPEEPEEPEEGDQDKSSSSSSDGSVNAVDDEDDSSVNTQNANKSLDSCYFFSESSGEDDDDNDSLV